MGQANLFEGDAAPTLHPFLPTAVSPKMLVQIFFTIQELQIENAEAIFQPIILPAFGSHGCIFVHEVGFDKFIQETCEPPCHSERSEESKVTEVSLKQGHLERKTGNND
jgi:hypothetical protein